MKHPIWLLFLFYFPTIWLQTYAARSLLGLRSHARKLAVFSLCQACIMFFVRDVLSLFGPHIVILLLTHIGLQVLLFKTSLFLEGIMVAILPLVLAMIGELTLVPLVLTLLGHSMVEAVSHLPLFLIIGWISNLPVILIALNMKFNARRELNQCI